MKDAYTKLMVQQHTSAAGDEAFYEALEKAEKKRKPVWKAAVAVACILLLIPVTVWAAETIFGVTTVTQTARPTYNNKPGIGLDIVFENIEAYPIEAFSEHLQQLTDYETAVHDSWAEAEEYLGIDLVDNIHFTAKDTYCRPAFLGKTHQETSVHPDKRGQLKKRFGKNTRTVCGVYDGQLYFSTVEAEFERDQTYFSVRAMVSVDLPNEIKEDIYNYGHGYSITYADRYETPVDVETEQYVTPAGIPVLIVTVTTEGCLSDQNAEKDWESLVDCVALFSVNNVSYRVHANWKSFGTSDAEQYGSPEGKIMPALLEFLDGFVIE